MQLAAAIYLVLKVRTMRIGIAHILDVERKAVRLRLVVVRYYARRRDGAMLDLVAGTAPEDVQSRIVTGRVRTVHKRRVALATRLGGHAEKVSIVEKTRAGDILAVLETDALRGGLAYLKVLDRDDLLRNQRGQGRDHRRKAVLAFLPKLLFLHPLGTLRGHALAGVPGRVKAHIVRLPAARKGLATTPGLKVLLRIALEAPVALHALDIVRDDIGELTFPKKASRQVVTVAVRLKGRYRLRTDRYNGHDGHKDEKE